MLARQVGNLVMYQSSGKEGHFNLVCCGTLVHNDMGPEEHTVNVEKHETTFTKDPDVSSSHVAKHWSWYTVSQKLMVHC